MKKIILIIILIPILILFLKIFDWAFLTKDITVYPVKCEKKLVENFCSEPDGPLDIIIFRISRTEKEISRWEKASSTYTAVSLYKNCMITSYFNWSCEKFKEKSVDSKESFGLNEGKYWEDPPGKYIYYVSKQEWLKLRCGSNCSLSEYLLFVLLN